MFTALFVVVFIFLAFYLFKRGIFFGQNRAWRQELREIIGQDVGLKELRAKFTPQVERCIIDKLGSQRVRQAVLDFKTKREIDREVIEAAKVCLGLDKENITLSPLGLGDLFAEFSQQSQEWPFV